jgi:Zn-dependent peptidase ImmA (M78 family)/predicted secreted protein
MNFRDAILEGAYEAGRLLKESGWEQSLRTDAREVDVFGAIVAQNIQLLFRPLDGLLGVYLPGEKPGIMVRTQRSLAIQRWTAAHELGHFVLKHTAHLDDDEMLRRSPFGRRAYDNQEAAADAFAIGFLMPKWLIELHARRYGWSRQDLFTPNVSYQLALRLGVSYEALGRTMYRYNLINRSELESLLEVQPAKVKKSILRGYKLPDWHPDVWMITEGDRGKRILASPGDVLVFHLREKSGAGFLWNLKDLSRAGFKVFADERRFTATPDSAVGGEVDRIVAARCEAPGSQTITLIQNRPWNAEIANDLSFTCDVNGRESGLPRVERAEAVAYQ